MTQASYRKLYRYIPIWVRGDGVLSLYRVIEIIDLGFVVQSRDFFSLDSWRERTAQLDQQFLELMYEIPPEIRMPPQKSIRAAIENFDKQFFQDGA